MTLILAIFIASVSVAASAQTLTGRVTNGTTGKPAAGDDVVLLSLSNGMQESGRTKSDAKGNFSLKVPDEGTPHLIRVIHQETTYHSMAPPGTTSVEVTVYDVATKVEGISVAADVMRLQADSNSLQIIRLFVVNNESKPPKTQMSDHNFEFYLPEGAQLVESMAESAGGKAVTTPPVPQKEKNRFALIFPLRPGETQFQVSYQLPYSGEASLDPRTLYPIERFGVMLPKSMKFSGPASFRSVSDPQQADSLVELASNVQPRQSLAFKVSGRGTFAERNENASATSGGQGLGAQSDSRPGGGLGPPIDAPDPLEKYRWPILGGFALVLAVGGYYIAKRSPAETPVTDPRIREDDETVELRKPPDRLARKAVAGETVTNAAEQGSPVPAPRRPGLLLEALKEELFQLEVERQQGRISQQEYEKHKAALDHTLQRAIQREAQKV